MSNAVTDLTNTASNLRKTLDSKLILSTALPVVLSRITVTVDAISTDTFFSALRQSLIIQASSGRDELLST
jgi:hypothetical protein